jgi:cell division protein ZapB
MNFPNYSAWVDAELKSLESKLGQFIELCHRLRDDNVQLRQQLASAMDQSKRLEEKINTATVRLESLLTQMPAEDEA